MFKYLDHPSEAFVEVTGKTEAEIFRDSAAALFDMMTDTRKVSSEREFHVHLESDELHFLLIDWLNQLILLHEVERVFLSEFDVEVSKDQKWRLTALARGEGIRENHERRLHAKSATYGQLQWNKDPDGHRVRFVIDI